MKWQFHHPVFEYEKMYLDLGGPWAGHKYFAYDLLRNLKPKKVVELGTHLGCSLFSFSQAIKDSKLNTTVDAVDTWQGDDHAGSYDEIVLNKVKEIKKAYYSKLKLNLVRKTFNQARKGYVDNSIDILHIDGCHTYKAVKHDYDTWFSKVKPDGIILLHDTSAREPGFGIHKLFNEIKKTQKTIEFAHSFGLGVVFKSAKTYNSIKPLLPVLPHYYQQVSQKEQLQYEFDQQKKFLNRHKKLGKIIANPALSPIYKIVKLTKRIIRN